MLSGAGRAAWALAVGVLALRGPDLPATVERLGSPVFPTALLALVELALLAVAAPGALVLGLALGRGRLARAAALALPRALRGVLVVGVVGALGVAPAHAERDVRVADPLRLDGLTLPDRPVGGTPTPAHRATAEDRQRGAGTVVVRPGDSLWALVADHLGPDADAGELAAGTRAWYAANRDVIGSDPDLVHPGQVLVVPQDAS